MSPSPGIFMCLQCQEGAQGPRQGFGAQVMSGSTLWPRPWERRPLGRLPLGRIKTSPGLTGCPAGIGKPRGLRLASWRTRRAAVGWGRSPAFAGFSLWPAALPRPPRAREAVGKVSAGRARSGNLLGPSRLVLAARGCLFPKALSPSSPLACPQRCPQAGNGSRPPPPPPPAHGVSSRSGATLNPQGARGFGGWFVTPVAGRALLPHPS